MAQISSNIKIDVNNNIIRERSTFSSKAGSRNPLISSSISLVPYYQYIEVNNDLLDNKNREPIDSSQLSYRENVKIEISVSITTDKPSPKKKLYIHNKTLDLKNISKP